MTTKAVRSRDRGTSGERTLGESTLRGLRGLGVRTASELSPDDPGRLFPVREELRAVLPFAGLRRGGTLAVVGSTSLTLSMLAEATVRGNWAAVIGRPDLSALAAAELGVELSRLALVPELGSEPIAALDALFEGIDLLVLSLGRLRLPEHRRTGTLRKLVSRAKSRGVALLVDEAVPGADSVIRCTGREWLGVQSGHGMFSGQRLHVEWRGHRDHGATVLHLPESEEQRSDSRSAVTDRAVVPMLEAG